MSDQTLPPEQMDSPSRKRKPSEPDSLAAKLAAACDEVGGIEKKGTNEAQRYKYVKAADVAKEIRHKLFSRGVVIIPDEIECTNQQLSFTNSKGESKTTNEVTVKTAYVITDGHETLTMHGYGIAWDSGDKAIYKAKTGSLKYFLRGLGLIPDEKDDPEADESVDKLAKDEEFKRDFDQRTESQRTNEPEYLAPYQQKAIRDAMAASGKTDADLNAYLGLAKVSDLAHVKKGEDFQKVLRWANGAKEKVVARPTPDAKKDGYNWAALFAKAAEKGYERDQVKDYYTQKYHVTSGTELTPKQFAELSLAVTEWQDLSK